MNTFVTLPARYLLGRKLRTTLTTLAVVFGVTVIFAVNLLLPTLVSAFDANVSGTTGQADLNVSSAGGEVFGDEILNTVRGTTGVAAATPMLRRQIVLPGGANQIELVGLDPQSAALVRRFAVTSGRFLNPGETDAAVLSQDTATLLGIQVGGQLQIPSPNGQQSLPVVGAIDLPGATEVLVPLATAQQWFAVPGRFNSVEVALTGGTDRDVAQAALQAAVGPAFTVGATVRGSDAITSIQIALVALNLVGLITLFMGGFLIFNTFRTVVIERRHDIGMLRAVGATRRTIVQLLLAESIIQGIIGTIIGLVLGYLFGALLVNMLQSFLSSYIKVRLAELTVTPGALALAIVLGIGVTVVAGLLPALNASKIPVLVALRAVDDAPSLQRRRRGPIVAAIIAVVGLLGLFSGNTALGALGALLFLTALVLLAPVLINPVARLVEPLMNRIFASEGLIAEGNLARNPSRSAVTVSALMIGLAILIGLGSMFTSINHAYADSLNKTLAADILLLPPNLAVWQADVGVGADFEQKLAAIPGVEAWSGLRYGSARVDNTVVQVLGLDPASYPKVSSLVFDQGGVEQFAALNNGRTAVINPIFAASLGLKVGDTMQLATPEGIKPYSIHAIGTDFLGLKINTIYISQANMAADFHKSENIMVLANLAPGANADQVRGAIGELLKSYPQLTLYWGADWRKEQLDVLNQTFILYYIILLALIVPSVLGLINTLAINVLERTREIGVLRAIGATQQQVRRMVIAEAILLCAAGTAMGIFGGLALGFALTHLIATALTSNAQFFFPLDWMLLAVAAAIVIAIGASAIPARQAARIKIVQALQYE